MCIEALVVIRICTYTLSLWTGYTNYNCTFPAMIDDWRQKWYQATGEQTDAVFPFGFVQVNLFPVYRLITLAGAQSTTCVSTARSN